MTIEVHDMPKLHSPFIRAHNESKFYVVTHEIEPGYEWVFEDPEVYAMEKLDGTNVSIVVEDGKIKEVWNRKNHVGVTQKDEIVWSKGYSYFDEAFKNAEEIGYLDNFKDGQHFGELIGPKLNKDPMHMDKHLWVPFNTFGKENLVYEQWKKIDKSLESLSQWFRNDLKSKFYEIHHPERKPEWAEGIVLYRPSTGDMAKLRRDMFEWWRTDNPGVINHHVVKREEKKPRKPKSEMEKEISEISRRKKQKLISDAEFQRLRDDILKKYGIK